MTATTTYRAFRGRLAAAAPLSVGELDAAAGLLDVLLDLRRAAERAGLDSTPLAELDIALRRHGLAPSRRDELGAILQRADRLVERIELRAQGRPAGELTDARLRLLREIPASDARCATTQARLAARLVIDKATVSRGVSALRAAGLVSDDRVQRTAAGDARAAQ